MRRMVFGLGILQVAVTGVLITATAYFAFGVELRSAILIGPVLALSSTAFVLQLLSEQKMLASDYGRTSVAVLLFQDLAVVPLLALASLLTVADLTIGEDIGLALLEALIILALIILGGRYLLQPVLHRVARLGSPEIFTASAVLLVLGTAVLMAQIGLSMAMGAFVAGLLVADSEFRHQVVAEIQPFRGLLLGLFFMSMGMSLELAQLFTAPLVSVGLVLLLMLTKAALLWPLVLLFGHRGGIALAIALLLAQSGEFALVIFAVAFEGALLDEELFQQLLLVVVLSMLATPPLAGLAYRLAASRRGHPRGEEFAEEDVAPVSIDDFHAMEQVVSSLHRAFPKLDILARGHNMDHCQSLRELGASLAVSENLEASIALAHAALAKVNGDDVENDAAIDRFRKDYYSDNAGKGRQGPEQH